MHPNVERVASAASRLGLTIEVRTFPEGTKTAADAATAIGVEVGQIVKSLVFGIEHADATTEIVMALMSGANQLDERKLATAAGGVRCTRVDADAVRAATGYPIGGVPPFGHATTLRMFADVDLLAFDEVWAAAGTWHDVFGIEPAALISAVSPTITALAK
jgi:prolyl-tRNA editing enzyme YbaK/EbsC (Cys-tRNA(Pro) deacylase)